MTMHHTGIVTGKIPSGGEWHRPTAKLLQHRQAVKLAAELRDFAIHDAVEDCAWNSYLPSRRGYSLKRALMGPATCPALRCQATRYLCTS